MKVSHVYVLELKIKNNKSASHSIFMSFYINAFKIVSRVHAEGKGLRKPKVILFILF